jgi:hypothetical protein
LSYIASGTKQTTTKNLVENKAPAKRQVDDGSIASFFSPFGT